MPALLDAKPGLEAGQQPGEVGVRQDVQVAGNRGPRHTRVPREAGDVDHLPVEKRGDRQETREARQVANQRLRLDLLLQIELGVGLQALAGILRLPDDGKAALAQHPAEVEVAPEFLGEERKHQAPHARPASRFVPACLQLARARSQQHEAQAPLLDEAVHFVQQRRQPLDLVDDDPAPRGTAASSRPKQARVAQVTPGTAPSSSRSNRGASGTLRAQVLLPTPRIPKRKKLWRGGFKPRIGCC